MRSLYNYSSSEEKEPKRVWWMCLPFGIICCESEIQLDLSWFVSILVVFHASWPKERVIKGALNASQKTAIALNQRNKQPDRQIERASERDTH